MHFKIKYSIAKQHGRMHRGYSDKPRIEDIQDMLRRMGKDQRKVNGSM
jgi:hypothetical protein